MTFDKGCSASRTSVQLSLRRTPKLTLRCPEEMRCAGTVPAFRTEHVLSGESSCAAPASVHLLCLGSGRTEVTSFFKSLYLGFTLHRVLFLILCFFSSLSRSPTGTPSPCSDLSGAINRLPTSAPTKCRVLGVSRSLLGRPLFQVSVSHSVWYKNTGGAQVL